MNYYEHHIGDYAQATAHLSFVEDAAYSRLIRKYYAEEKPIPADLKTAQRLVGARTREEREAVQAVLEEFFVLADDGWHSKRCDEEISEYRVKQGKARASANARWEKRNAAGMRTHTGGNANASGVDGCERNANASETHDGRNALQTPDTRHQTPKDQERERASGAPQRAAKRAPKDFALTDEQRQWAASECPGIDIAAETAKFVDHTFSTARSDWPATWRNWIRRAWESRQSRTAPARSKHDLSGMDYSRGVNANGTF